MKFTRGKVQQIARSYRGAVFAPRGRDHKSLDCVGLIVVICRELEYPHEDLPEYDQLAKEHFDADRFEEFCATHLRHLDEVALEFFSTTQAKDIFREKVAALFPKHEVEEFTDHFYGLVQFWCRTEQDRLK
jgi:hypothetical protein